MKKNLNTLFLIGVGLSIFGCITGNRAEHFNKHASSSSSKPDEIIRSLNIKQGQSICDIGSGGGYFSFRFAQKTGDKGKVYAVDINNDFLSYINKQAAQRKITNIITVLATETDSGLPNHTCDLIFMRDVYHHISNRVAYFQALAKKLKPGGRIAIIDYRKKGFIFKIIMRHHITERKVIIKEMTDAGFTVNEEFKFLPRQNFLIFQIKLN